MLKKLLILKALSTIFCSGLFAFDIEKNYLSSSKDSKLLLKSITGLTDEEKDIFMLGRSFFNIPWVKAPSITTARDGLGPLFNANSCVSCHPNNGRGNVFNKDFTTSRAIVARLSKEKNDSKKDEEVFLKKGFIPEPIYGEQLAINGIFGVPFEGNIKLDFEEKNEILNDGTRVILQKPKYSLENLNYGNIEEDTIVSFRIAQSLNGMALIDMILDEEILKNQDLEDLNNDGISGKVNYVYSPISNRYEIGKYTWKASVAFLKEQIANAASNDIGLTTSVNPSENCTDFQEACKNAPKAKDSIDLPDERLDSIAFYLKNIKSYTPKNTKEYNEGLALFDAFKKMITLYLSYSFNFTNKF